jgi:hypothetical protein
VDVLPHHPLSAPAPVRRRPRRPGPSTAHILVLVAAVAVLALLVPALLVPALFGAVRGGATAAAAGPPVPTDAATTALATPPPAPAGSGGYVFMATQDDGSGDPVRWDPCRPIHYVLRPEGAPPGGQALVEQSIARISELTGLVFVDDGRTDEAPDPDRRALDRARYGDRWSPVLIAWTDPAELPEMAGAAGRGGPVPVSAGAEGRLRYVSGVVYLNGANLRDVANWNAGRAKIRGVILHELGHLVGLGHAGDPNQLMFDRQTVLAGERLGDGDLRGLAALGGGPCFGRTS